MREKEELTAKVEELLQQINTEVTTVLGERVKTIGKLSSEELSTINRLLDFYGQDMATINKRLSELSNKTIAEIEKMLIDSAKEAGIDVAEFYEKAGVEQIPYEENKALQRIVASAVKNASDEVLAISNTTAMGFLHPPSGACGTGNGHKRLCAWTRHYHLAYAILRNCRNRHATAIQLAAEPALCSSGNNRNYHKPLDDARDCS